LKLTSINFLLAKNKFHGWLDHFVDIPKEIQDKRTLRLDIKEILIRDRGMLTSNMD
jgi:hypothetical protein